MKLKAFGFEIVIGKGLETKSSAVQPLIALQYGNNLYGVAYKRNPIQYADDAYKRNSVAFACIGLIARHCSYVPIKLKRGDKIIDEHPILDLLQRPNPWQSGQKFIEAVIAYYLIAGNSYVEGVGPDGQPPLELWALRPDRTRVKSGTYGPEGYVYEVNGQLKTWQCDPLLGASPILHIKSFNPLDDWYGMSPVEAAAFSVDQHNSAGEWNQALLQNSARPSGAMVYKNENGGTLTDKQFERLKEEINSSFAGTRNAGRVPVLEGGLEWQQMSMSPVDLDWINGKNMSAREIALVFSVPPMMLGIPGDNTYSNYQEARQALYEDTVLPMLDSFLEAFGHWLLPAYGNSSADLRLVADIDRLPALEGKRQARWAAVQNAQWLTLNEKREATGYKPLEQEEANEVFINSGLVPLTGSTAEPDSEELDEDGEPLKPSEDEDEDAPVKKKSEKRKYVWEL